jgi:hypothetical protein
MAGKLFGNMAVKRQLEGLSERQLDGLSFELLLSVN